MIRKDCNAFQIDDGSTASEAAKTLGFTLCCVETADEKKRFVCFHLHETNDVQKFQVFLYYPELLDYLMLKFPHGATFEESKRKYLAWKAHENAKRELELV